MKERTQPSGAQCSSAMRSLWYPEARHGLKQRVDVRVKVEMWPQEVLEMRPAYYGCDQQQRRVSDFLKLPKNRKQPMMKCA